MNIESKNINVAENSQVQKTNKKPSENASVKFKDELKEVENKANKEEAVVAEEEKNTKNQISGNKEIERKESQTFNHNNNNVVDTNTHYNDVLNKLDTIVKELHQSDDNSSNLIKKEDTFNDNKDMINNDFNIQDNKEILPQMNPNMNFAGNGQPFSSFMNNEENSKNKSNVILNTTMQDLAEEAAILSTMSENIAIANKNQIQQKPQEEVKTVHRNDGIKKVNIESNTTIETIVKYDSIIMNEADVEVFKNLVENGEVNMNQLSPKAAEKSVQVSKTLADMLAKAMEKNQPVRIEFDNNISVIIKISRDGKITADFLPSSQVAEAYLKENLPLLRQKFEDNNIEYESLNQRERKDPNKENNRKKDRNNE